MCEFLFLGHKFLIRNSNCIQIIYYMYTFIIVDPIIEFTQQYITIDTLKKTKTDLDNDINSICHSLSC